jgi:hypothetical protein
MFRKQSNLHKSSILLHIDRPPGRVGSSTALGDKVSRLSRGVATAFAAVVISILRRRRRKRTRNEVREAPCCRCAAGDEAEVKSTTQMPVQMVGMPVSLNTSLSGLMSWLANLRPNDLSEGLQICLQLGGEVRLPYGALLCISAGWRAGQRGRHLHLLLARLVASSQIT